MRFDEYPYGSIAAIYDVLATIYSRGRIAESKRTQIDAIGRGDRILYAGVGRGEDALQAARTGARVVAIDLAPAMLSHVSKRFARAGLEAELVRGDVALYAPSEPFDIIAANYFLNLFETERARQMLVHLRGMLRPEGRLLLTDFAPAQGGPLARAITALYYRPANWIAWVFGFCALHPILDYGPMLESHGFRIRSERRFPVALGNDPAYLSIDAQRVG